MKRFGDLVALLRVDPGNDAAQDLALAAASGAVSVSGVTLEAGIESGTHREDLSLQGRLRARQVDAVRVAAGAESIELLMLARALSHDVTPVPSTPTVEVDLMSTPALPFQVDASYSSPSYAPERGNPERRRMAERRRATTESWLGPERRRAADRRGTGERRLWLIKHQEQEIARLVHRLEYAVGAADWAESLELADRLRVFAARVPAAERRTFAIHVRHHLGRPALDGIVQLALRDQALQPLAAGVLRWTGLDGAEAMLAAVASIETVAPRQFLHDALAAMPDAFPVIAPLLRSPVWYEAHHAAELLGRQGRLEAIEVLKEHADHADERVRAAVLRSLAAFPTAAVAEALLIALAHTSSRTRAAAAEAIGIHRAPALAMPLVTALAKERNSAAWSAMARALGTIGSPDACSALAVVALTRRGLLWWRGYSTRRRVEAVGVLAAVQAAAAGRPMSRCGAPR
jgi:hypothetical protein